MSHMVETMAFSGETPWHGLGEPVSNDLTPHQMMVKAGVDWEVEEIPSFIELGGEKVLTGQKTLIRKTDNKILTNVGRGWHPNQNSVAFDFFHEFVLAGDMEMHTAGSLRGGQIVWALAKVRESFDVFGDDRVDSYLLFANPHLYGYSIDIRFTPVRAVCNNTLMMALNTASKNAVRVGHRAEFDPDKVKDVMGLAHEKFGKYKEMAEFLGSKKVTAEKLIEYYDQVFPKLSEDKAPATKYEELSRPAKVCYDALETQPGAEYAKGTFWPAFNSVTYFTDHIQGRDEDTRLYNQWFGANVNRKAKAAQLAVEMAKAA